MNQSLQIPESYKQNIAVAIKGMGCDCDTVICTKNKKLMTFFKGCLIKSCNVDIEVEHLEPFVTYEPKFEVYYILHGDNKIVIVKEGTSLEIVKIHPNVYEMIVSDHNNIGIPQLYIRTKNGFECVDILENMKQIDPETNHEFQETTVVYSFCVKKLQKLKILYDDEKNKISQKATYFMNAIMQVSNNDNSDVKASSNIIAKNSWIRLSNENLVYGFTLENTSKLPIQNCNLLLLEDNKQIWSRFRFEFWKTEKNKNAFNFMSGCENNSISNTIGKYYLNLNSESSIIVSSIIENWCLKSLPYFINGIVYINDKNYDRIQYINTDAIMVTSNLFLGKEFEIFVKNSVFIEDLVTLYSTTLQSCYQIKCVLGLKDLKHMIINNFKFVAIQNWLVHSSLLWLRTIICCLDQISPFEFILKVFSNSCVFIKTFINILSTILPEHTCINSFDNKVLTQSNIFPLVFDLKELRKVFKEYLNEQIIIPRDQWNSTRLKLENMTI
ncbi:Hypothetical protein CINCED_3A008140 [Cinara cedri]|uniref:Uncharacterized protein n=1 Tax=Cinara cedri TaxID=506608 RepID=A0A5E4MLA5_9HEMI|nr:Hypothetical protein CINCED_3A008140 [Cinara cedri]